MKKIESIVKKKLIYSMAITLISIFIFSYNGLGLSTHSVYSAFDEVKIVIQKRTTKGDLERIKKEFHEKYGVELTYSDLYFTSNNELASISITYKDGNGNKGVCNQKNIDFGIDPIEIVLSFDDNGNFSGLAFNVGKKGNSMQRQFSSSSPSMSNSSHSYAPSRTNEKSTGNSNSQKTLNPKENFEPIITITKNTSDLDLKKFKSELKANAIDLDYNNLIRNSLDEIVCIHLNVSDRTGYINEYTVCKSESIEHAPIMDIDLIKYNGGLLFTNNQASSILKQLMNEEK